MKASERRTSDANAQRLPTSKEKKFAIPTTVRNTVGVSVSNPIAIADRDA